jgi:solute:Na+ symporter, SSS family
MTTLFDQSLIGPWDAALLAFLLAVMVGLGFFLRKRQTSTQQFFLAGRRLPVWAACLSFVATEVSAVTIISVPATAYMENWEYLQFFIGSAAARLCALHRLPLHPRFLPIPVHDHL